ncbi:unnamed protein product, partial [Rotaria magnacalcarata]
DSPPTLVRMLNGNSVQNDCTKMPASQQQPQINQAKVIS